MSLRLVLDALCPGFINVDDPRTAAKRCERARRAAEREEDGLRSEELRVAARAQAAKKRANPAKEYVDELLLNNFERHAGHNTGKQQEGTAQLGAMRMICLRGNAIDGASKDLLRQMLGRVVRF